MRHLDLSITSYSKHNQVHIEDIHRENTPSNKTQVLTKSIITYIPAIGTLNQLFLRGYYVQIKILKNEVFYCKILLKYFVLGPLCIPHSICPFAFDRVVLYENIAVLFVVLRNKKRYPIFFEVARMVNIKLGFMD